jgi:hypothetical protein
MCQQVNIRRYGAIFQKKAVFILHVSNANTKKK